MVKHLFISNPLFVEEDDCDHHDEPESEEDEHKGHKHKKSWIAEIGDQFVAF